MQMLNISILLMQSIRNFQEKLWISLYMHKENPYLKANRKNGSFQKAVILSKKILFGI